MLEFILILSMEMFLIWLIIIMLFLGSCFGWRWTVGMLAEMVWSLGGELIGRRRRH